MKLQDIRERLCDLKIGQYGIFTHTEYYPTGMTQVDQWFFERALEHGSPVFDGDYIGHSNLLKHQLEYLLRNPPRRRALFGWKLMGFEMDAAMYVDTQEKTNDVVRYEFTVTRKF